MPRLGQAGTASQLNAISCAQLDVSAQQIQLCSPYRFMSKRTSKQHQREREVTAKCGVPAHWVSKHPIPHQSRRAKQAAVNCSPLWPKGAEVFPIGEEAKGPGAQVGCAVPHRGPRSRVAGYAPLGCAPVGQDLLQGVQAGLHGERCREPAPSLQQQRCSWSRARWGSAWGARTGAGREGASPAHPFNRQAGLMTELRSPAASQPWIWSNCACCRHRADEMSTAEPGD